MADVSVGFGALVSAASILRDAGREVGVAGDTGYIDDATIGSGEVCAAIGQVAAERGARAELSAEALRMAGGRPELAATELCNLD